MIILVVVCHPDDEALWLGATLTGSRDLIDVEFRVVCLSGVDSTSQRSEEFQKARDFAGYASGRVVGGPLRAASTPLPDMAPLIESVLVDDHLAAERIGLVISHSPFGDEHRHPHHRQAYGEVRAWAHSHKLSFAFFSPICIPAGKLKPMLKSLPHSTHLHVTQIAECKFGLLARVKYWTWTRKFHTPKFLIQILGSGHLKSQMLHHYQSINLMEHIEGYAAFTSPLESLYFEDRRGFQLMVSHLEQLPIPGPQPLFRSLNQLISAKTRGFSRGSNANGS